MMDWKMFGVEAFAVAASFIIILASVANAATVGIYYGSVEFDSISSFNPWGLLSRHFDYSPGTDTVTVTVANSTPSISVGGAWLYRCRDLQPSQCAGSVSPEHATGDPPVQGYAWSELKGAGSTGNLLTVAKVVNGGKETWVGYWTVLSKSGQAVSVQESGISDIKVYSSSVDYVQSIKSFMETYGMIPVKAAWVTRVVLTGASSLHAIYMESEADFSGPEAEQISGDEMEPLDSGYAFVLPVVSSKARNPAVLFRNPEFECGDGKCDTGESSATCCTDCTCSGDFYCDSSGSCKPRQSISLGLYGQVNPSVENCYEPHTIGIPVSISNPPTGYSVDSTLCVLGGATKACTCTKSGSYYMCSLDVPAIQGCGSGDEVISGNSISFTIIYPSGSGQESRTISTAFPDVTVGSFVCGDNQCDTNLGESSATCCRDCACSRSYCDYMPGDESMSCRLDPAAPDIKTLSIEPAHFYDHSPGEHTSIKLELDYPRSASLVQESCTLGCTSDHGGCTSSCDIDCSEDAGTGMNLSCTMTFTISDYDSLLGYSLSPELSLGISYSNGTSGLTRTITKSLSQLSIGAHWCGDLRCGEDESPATCCYDCNCTGGQYCFTRDSTGPSQGDGCMDTGFGLDVTSIGSLNLEDVSNAHDVPVSMTIEGFPQGSEVVAECTLAGGDVPCSMDCQRSLSVEGYSLDCDMNVPAMDYVSSPYYDTESRTITLEGNSIDMTLLYNDGPLQREAPLQHELGDVAVGVTSHCGEGGCEDWLGESPATCCRDCGCAEGMFCYQGDDTDGECIMDDTIALSVTEIDPDPPQCIVGRIGGECKFIRNHIAEMHIINSPPDLEIAKAYYELDGDSAEVDCIKANGYGNWSCAFIPEPLEYGSGVLEKDIKFDMSVRYDANGTERLSNISDTVDFNIDRKKSDALQTCEEEMQRIQREIAKVEENQRGYNAEGILYAVMGAATIAIGIFYLKVLVPACDSDPKCAASTSTMLTITGYTYIATGALQLIMSLIGNGDSDEVQNQIDELNELLNKKKEICSSEDFEKVSLQTEGMTAMTHFVPDL